MGAALAATAVVLPLLPLIQGRDWGWPWWGTALMALAVPVTALFLWWERRLAARGGQPVLDPALLRRRAFALGLAAALPFFGALGAFFLLLSLYLQAGTGRGPWETGLVILPFAVGSVLTSGIGVRFADRAGRAVLVSGALLPAASQLLLLALLHGPAPAATVLAVPLLVGGLGLGLTAPSLVNVVLAGVPARDAGAAGGVLSTVTQLGGAAGVAVLGTVFFARLEHTLADGATAAAAHTEALAAALPWQAACYAVAAVLLFLLPARTHEETTP
ncbi:MFS transporter [Nocardiopsis protaetiae]|uniref:MFS transporter n=1 Tax=Nocardiopsis protaetiae TaxID=3382270 RepID=UPI00387B4DE2